MKTKSIILGVLSICLITGSAFGQGRKKVKKEVKSVKTEIRKEVRMEEENGVKTLTISTDENGTKTEEVFVGAEADKKMAEMESGMDGSLSNPKLEGDSKKIKESVEVEINDDGKNKKVTIKKSSNGKETIEIYEGAEADEKIKELENEAGSEFTGEEKIIVKKKKVKRSRKRRSSKKSIKE